MPIDVELVVNGEVVKRRVNPKASLLGFLRDDLGLKGTKEGCGTGDCGTCLVLVDGQPVDSCLFNMRRANGVSVETIEGICQNGLHPVQTAFLECGAVQCGFCIPGMVMASKALLDKNPSPAECEIREGLKEVICRCTGYTQIFEAVQKASYWMAHPEDHTNWRPRSGGLGVSSVLAEGRAAVTRTISPARECCTGRSYGVSTPTLRF